jgi:uncharacterized membrane-anchored protein
MRPSKKDHRPPPAALVAAGVIALASGAVALRSVRSKLLFASRYVAGRARKALGSTIDQVDDKPVEAGEAVMQPTS